MRVKQLVLVSKCKLLGWDSSQFSPDMAFVSVQRADPKFGDG